MFRGLRGRRVTARVIPPGKLPTPLLARLLAQVGGQASGVRLGPAVGEDACALDVGAASSLVVATDPITFAGASPSRSAVLVNANDVAATGARPRWFLATLLLPPESREGEVERLFAEMQAALETVGAVAVGGHTEVTDAVRRPVVVGQMLGLAERVVPTGGLRPGDVLLQVGPAPVEGAAILASRLPGGAAPEDPEISVVEPALLAAELGAVAMHDPTEGGLAGALGEMALASGTALRVDRAAVLWSAPGLEICRALGADPWATLASGTLLAGFPPDQADQAAAHLRAAGHQVAPIAVAQPGTGVHDHQGVPIPWPARDEVARLS